MQPQDAFLLQGYNCCWHPLHLPFFHVNESIFTVCKENTFSEGKFKEQNYESQVFFQDHLTRHYRASVHF